MRRECSEDADGVITFTGDQSAMADCAFAPDEYTIKIYKMALCTTAQQDQPLLIHMM